MPQPPPPGTITGLRVAIIGAGRLGTSLALALRPAGVALAGYSGLPGPDTRRAARLLALEPTGSLDRLVATGVDAYFLTVPDTAIPSVAEDLALALSSAGPAMPSCSPPFVLHTSGVTPVSALDPCAHLGAITIGFHPLQTFSDPAVGPDRLRGCTVAIASEQVKGRDMGTALAEALGSRSFLLDERRRPLYHAAACIASNYLVSLLYLAESLFADAGLPRDQALHAFMPLVQGAVSNVRRQGTVDALTGPLSRGDAGTIATHLLSLNTEAPEALPAYRALGLLTLAIIRRRGDVPQTTISSLEHLLSSDIDDTEVRAQATPTDGSVASDAGSARPGHAPAATIPPAPTDSR